MIALRSVCFALFCSAFLWSSALSYRRPLGDFLKDYETLNYDTTPVLDQHNRVRRSSPNSDHRIELNLKTSQREFKIRLKRDTDLFTDDFQADNSDFDPAKVVTGDVEGHKKSLVHGFISDDGVFEGKIHVGNDEYFVESAKQYFKDAPQDFHSVIYESRDIHYPHAYGPDDAINEKTKRWMDEIKRTAMRRKFDEIEHDSAKFDAVNKRYRRAKQLIDPQKVSCTLKIVADHLFTVNMADSNKERAMLLMANHVKAANAIYKNTGFATADKPEGIQFQIQRMGANDSADAYVENNPFRDNNIGVKKLLEFNSEVNHDDVCLAYVFTYRDFADGALGLAWMGETGGAAGGICEKSVTFRDGKKKSLNTGVVTFVNYGRKIPQKVSQIVFAHQTGHNFGSPHDTTAQCSPGGSAGNYIMFGGSSNGDQPNNRLFSPCSRRKMNAVMEVKGRCTEQKCCFKAPAEAICGNMVVEKGEQCDCGYQTDKSCALDKCCRGRSAMIQIGDCQLLPGKICSPSEGSCCSDECILQNTSSLCRKETECTDSSYCNGINATCAVQQKPDLTECNYGKQVCLAGECTGSFCLKYGLLGCQCKQGEHLCHLCCKDGQNGECKPTKDIPNMNKDLHQFPGAPCNDFNGYCDKYLKCRVMAIDSPTNHAKAIYASMLKAIVAFVTIIVHELA